MGAISNFQSCPKTNALNVLLCKSKKYYITCYLKQDDNRPFKIVYMCVLECHTIPPLDAVILFDDSGSISPENFQTMIKFIKSLIGMFVDTRAQVFLLVCLCLFYISDIISSLCFRWQWRNSLPKCRLSFTLKTLQ